MFSPCLGEVREESEGTENEETEIEAAPKEKELA